MSEYRTNSHYQNGDDVFVFHSAPKYPAVGCEGLRKSFYECLMRSFLLPENDMMDVTVEFVILNNISNVLLQQRPNMTVNIILQFLDYEYMYN